MSCLLHLYALYNSRMQASVGLDTSSPTSSAFAARTAAATTSTTAGAATSDTTAGATASNDSGSTGSSTKVSSLKGSPITAADKRTSLSAAGNESCYMHTIVCNDICSVAFTVHQ
jgi:hypothetical protein